MRAKECLSCDRFMPSATDCSHSEPSVSHVATGPIVLRRDSNPHHPKRASYRLEDEAMLRIRCWRGGSVQATEVQDCAFAARPTIHASVCDSGAHRLSLDNPPSWERFSCGVRGVGRIRTSGGLHPCCFRDSRIRPLCHYSTDPHEGTNWLTYSYGSRAPGGIRTHDHKVRTLLL